MRDIFFTSKGRRHRSQAHQLACGGRIRWIGRSIQYRSDEKSTWQTTASLKSDEIDKVSTDSAWKSYVTWTNARGSDIWWFAASWTVPVEPEVSNGQTIYLFNGLQDAEHRFILQPVLQWGPSPSEGMGWSIASYWVGGPTDPLFCSEAVSVSPGDVVTGRIVLSPNVNRDAQGVPFVDCVCSFDNFPQTALVAENLPALFEAVATLEAYNVSTTAPYPPILETTFSDLRLETRSGTPSVAWQPFGNAEIVKDGAMGGTIKVKYPQVLTKGILDE